MTVLGGYLTTPEGDARPGAEPHPSHDPLASTLIGHDPDVTGVDHDMECTVGGWLMLSRLAG